MLERSVLIVEDDQRCAKSLSRVLRGLGWQSSIAGTLQEARALLNQRRWLVVALDLQLPDGDGASLLPAIDANTPKPVVIVVSGHIDSRRVAQLCRPCRLMVPKPTPANVWGQLLDFVCESVFPDTWVEKFCEHHGLSERESELLYVVAREDLSGKEAAARLKCKEGTIGSFWSRIFHKTGYRTQRDVMAAMFRVRCLRN